MLYHNQKSISGTQRDERGFVFEIWSIPRLILVIPDFEYNRISHGKSFTLPSLINGKEK